MPLLNIRDNVVGEGADLDEGGRVAFSDRAGVPSGSSPSVSSIAAHPSRGDRQNRWYSADEVKAVIAGRARGLSYRAIGYPLGRTHGSVKGFVARNGITARKVEWPLR
jgi:hypothetical protein